MMATEAADLATRISQSWPRGVNTSVWEDVLTPLDAGAAGTAYVRLLHTENTSPTVAKFLDMYRSIRASDIRAEDRPDCDRCGSTGWERGADIVRTDADGTECYRTTSVAPCRWCDTGKQTGPVHMAVLRANGHLLKDVAP